jgi:flagellin
LIDRITPNINSLVALRNIRINKANLNKSLERLATGRRINRGADDPAGLSISETLRAEARGLEQASRNIGHGLSMIQTAEGGLSQIGGLLERAFELAVQASNGTNSPAQSTALDNEFQTIKAEIDRISQSSEFNGQKLLNGELAPGSATQKDVQVSTDSSAQSRINLNVIENMSPANLGIDGLDLSTPENAQNALSAIENAISNVSQTRGSIGALQNRFTSAAQSLGISIENIRASESLIRDADFAYETANLKKNMNLFQASLKSLALATTQGDTKGSILNIIR